jgi:hypothetical protein
MRHAVDVRTERSGFKFKFGFWHEFVQMGQPLAYSHCLYKRNAIVVNAWVAAILVHSEYILIGWSWSLCMSKCHHGRVYLNARVSSDQTGHRVVTWAVGTSACQKHPTIKSSRYSEEIGEEARP